jgi:hypothetical protein
MPARFERHLEEIKMRRHAGSGKSVAALNQRIDHHRFGIPYTEDPDAGD